MNHKKLFCISAICALFSIGFTCGQTANAEGAFREKLKKATAVSKDDFKQAVAMVVKDGHPGILNLISSKVRQEDIDAATLRTIYQKHSEMMWDESKGKDLLYCYVRYAMLGKANQSLKELEADALRYRKKKFSDEKSWQAQAEHPSQAGMGLLVTWIGDVGGVERIAKLYERAKAANNIGIIQAIVGAYKPTKEDYLDAAKLFIRMDQEMHEAGHGKVIRWDVLAKAKWLRNEVHDPLKGLNRIYKGPSKVEK